ncbi:MAG: tRNA preQ1(34) S-adenosylmethionine ribosyltransferase-isomerase QueA [Chlamydiales bacterium]|nr:tRNA preQ1(34) S-adenosylmethionine ribosyltransferase-isomerase QueA [Chlamydiia bacterium]MCP5507670.1 tRNA preQ1(34) S-adenosylmethionine ribosyltransferase-isomerase QueA [Chlamydiales bacterium]
MKLHRLESYHYHLPEQLIAQYPTTPRDHSRLLVVDRKSGTLSHHHFYDLPSLLCKDDTLIFNDTKVIPARLLGQRPNGGKAEVFLTRPLENNRWEALVRPGKKLRKGGVVFFGDDLKCVVESVSDEGTRIVRFDCNGDFNCLLEKYGSIPLPPYIQRSADAEVDADRYQTVYASKPGAVAAPTAGLHFTPEVMQNLAQCGVGQLRVTLHVGLGTFLPVQNDDITKHRMHSERFIINDEAARALNEKSSGRRVCVGTTSCRVLESISGDLATPGEYETNIFIYPGYTFKRMDGLLTNFHLPGSTLLMLVSAFAGYDLIMQAYDEAVKEKYRFFSYGDAMLIL